jgi:hypothetical protein
MLLAAKMKDVADWSARTFHGSRSMVRAGYFKVGT